MQKGNPIARVLQFAKRKSFYIVLGLCAVAIAVSGYILFFTGGEEQPDPVLSGREPPQDRQTVSGSASDVTIPTPEQTEQEKQPEPAAPQPVKTADVPADQPPAQTTVSQPGAEKPEAKETGAKVQEKLPVFTFPVRGAEVQREYSGAQLVFDETMGDWRTHSGLDIAASLGTEVLAVAAGTVASIEDDVLMGTTIVVDHGDGLKSVYANLAAAPAVQVGDAVQTGAVLGAVGDTAAAEAAKPSHLHFEMIREDESVDPVSFLPQHTP